MSERVERYRFSNGQPYHFETSQAYVPTSSVAEAAAQVRGERTWSGEDLAQLQSIVLLETLRAKLAAGSIPLSDYRAAMDNAVAQLERAFRIHPFDDTYVHQRFYRLLNELEGPHACS